MCFYKNKNILAVDDYEDNLFLIKLIFETLGCHVRTAGNGKEGLIGVKQARPNLIILDLMMPEMSGVEFMKCLKKQGLSDIPILLLTANANLRQEDVKNADSICYKPIDITNLVEEARKLLLYLDEPR